MKELITFTMVLMAIFIWSAAVFHADAQYYDYTDGGAYAVQQQQMQQQLRRQQSEIDDMQAQQNQRDSNSRWNSISRGCVPMYGGGEVC